MIVGVSGGGKSTVAGLLAGRLGWDLAEGDDMHAAANIAKMAAGQPLNDADRWPWLARVAEWIRVRTAADRPGIVTCSALKRGYRDVLRGPSVVFVYLAGSRELIARRVAARQGHFMPAELLEIPQGSAVCDLGAGSPEPRLPFSQRRHTVVCRSAMSSRTTVLSLKDLPGLITAPWCGRECMEQVDVVCHAGLSRLGTGRRTQVFSASDTLMTVDTTLHKRSHQASNG